MARHLEKAFDFFGQRRIFCCEENTINIKYLKDTLLNVSTYYYNHLVDDNFPGRNVTNPPSWRRQVISAHANTCDVIKFFRDVLGDEASEGFTKKCILSLISIEDTLPNRLCWDNGMWSKDYQQLIFGQGVVRGRLRSLAVNKDIVAHELAHALIIFICALDYKEESGALEESYADIFAVIIANYPNTNIQEWNWKLGDGFGKKGGPVRVLNHPAKFGQPEHMDDYRYLLDTQSACDDNDWGWLHHNSGIHNKAGYNLLTAKDSQGNFFFSPDLVAQLFYQALYYLRPNSDFRDSRTAIEMAAKTLFRKDGNKQEKLEAIAIAFNQVGIFS
jgi:bacillolysin